jgi:hypothetical protein
MVNEIITVSSSPHPFKEANQFDYVEEGACLSEILAKVQPDPVLRSQACIFINDELIHFRLWDSVVPAHGDFVYISVVPGKGGGKSPLKSLATIAVIAASAHFGPGLGAGIAKGLFSKGIVSLSTGFATAIGKAIIGGVGMLALNTLSPPARASNPNMPSLSGAGSGTESPTLTIEGARNSLQQFGTIPSVLGVHKHVPPLGAQTYTEVIGKDQYLKMLVVWGFGRLKIDDIKIGTTPIADFDGVEIETVEGLVSDNALTVYPNKVTQENLSIALTFDAGYITRTTELNTDQISIDISFLQGLTQYDNNGNRIGVGVVHQVQYRAVGDVTWLAPTFSIISINASSVSSGVINVTDSSAKVVRHGFRWDVTNGQYEVRVKRVSASEDDDTKVYNSGTWTALRSFTNTEPISFPHPLAKTALSIKATSQLNGIVDNLNATVSSYVQDFDGASTWALGVSSNPASLFRHVLQGNANVKAVADARIDLTALEAFHTYCATNGFEFNMIRDYKSSVWDTLADICAVARATPTDLDGTWSVIIDQAKATPTQHFTSRNTWEFRAEKVFIDAPHGFKMRFPNRNKEYKQDELIVYDDGFDSTNATEFEQLDGIGITDEDHLWKFGRFHLAGIRLRLERYTFNVDFEHIVARRGDRVKITHDVLLVGIATGRITAIQTNGGGDATGITVDEIFTMESAKSYGVSIRTVGDAAILKTVTLDVGDQTTIVFDAVIDVASVPIVGDLVSFGLAGLETLDALILAIEPHEQLTARLTCIPYSVAIFSSDTGTIPAFDSKITATATLPDVVINDTRTDESVLIVGAGGSLLPRIAISFSPILDRFNATINTEIRVTSSDAPFVSADVAIQTSNEIIIQDVQEGESYDIRLQWRSSDFIVNGAFSYSNGVLVTGQTNDPEALNDLTISTFGGSALLRWSLPTELDVLFGGTIQFRHSHETVSANASWSASVGIGTGSQGSDKSVVLPLKQGTYLARVFDKGGRNSAIVKIDTKQASVLVYSDADTDIVEEGAFGGTHTNTIVDGVTLKLAGAGEVDDIVDVDSVVDWDATGGIEASGTYDFLLGFDLTTVKKVRLTTDINAIVTNVIDLIDSRTDNIDTWEDIDGDTSGEADARVQVRVTDDDPAGSPTWTAWNDLESSEYTARGFDFRLQMTSSNTAFNIFVTKLQVKAEEVL